MRACNFVIVRSLTYFVFVAVPQKRQAASIQPNDSGRSELEYGRRAGGNRGRAWEGVGKKWDGMENMAVVPGVDGTDRT